MLPYSNCVRALVVICLLVAEPAWADQKTFAGGPDDVPAYLSAIYNFAQKFPDQIDKAVIKAFLESHPIPEKWRSPGGGGSDVRGVYAGLRRFAGLSPREGN